MPDYDLSRLSPRTFEQLIQAISLRVVAPGITVFGDGPDGGREASFEGAIDYPSAHNPWNGYGIIQAKFRQESEGTSRDGQWAVEQLKDEFKKRSSSKRKLKRPQFYIYATNVTLSPGATTGAKDKIAHILSTEGSRLGITDFRIWDGDQISRYLDSLPDIRRTYAAWVTAGDVLAEIIESLKSPQRPDLSSTIDLFVEKQLLAEQYARLDTVWTDEDRQMPLARVFVDLPAQQHRAMYSATIGEVVGEAPSFVARLLAWAEDKQQQRPEASPRTHLPAGAHIGRFVLVGGPGQGKSTVGQFTCQLFRASILQAREGRITPEARRALSLIKSQAQRTGLSVPRVRRFPIKVELRRLAASLASSQNPSRSLLSWIAQEIRITTDREVETEDIRRILSAWPSILVLDGLDEVPASSNREAVLKVIREFFVDVCDAGADLLVLATTRPQGYNDDFNPELYDHWYLLPLTGARAKLYASLLFEQRHKDDLARRSELNLRIDSALSSEHTARLMQSPLQVTIMSTLVERVGQPPQNRWRLFREYYDTIYRREMERSIPTSVILRENQTIVDRLHYEIGFELQVAAEGRGGTEARMPIQRLELIVGRFFSDAGWDEADIHSKVEAIRKAATERLVFLVAVNEGFVGFELRSLQEFMAAEHLSRGRDDDVRARLRAIAPAVHWRNVFRFAAGRILSEADHLLDSVCQLCHELNEDSADSVDADTLTGSRIAIDLLEDGFAQQQPRTLKSLARAALRVLELVPEPVHLRLADACDQHTSRVFQDVIRPLVSQHNVRHGAAAWTVLLRLLRQDKAPAWVSTLITEYWPKNRADVVRLVSAIDLDEVASTFLVEQFLIHIEELPVLSVIFRGRRRAHRTAGDETTFFDRSLSANAHWGTVCEVARDAWASMHRTDAQRLRIQFRIAGHQKTTVGVDLRSVETASTWQIPLDRDAPRGEWSLLHTIGAFNANPSCSTLLSAIEATVTVSENVLAYASFMTSWPLAAILHWIGNRRRSSPATWLSMLVSAVERGQLGDLNTWIDAERRWATHGLHAEDFGKDYKDSLPFDHTIGVLGAPPMELGWYPTYYARGARYTVEVHKALQAVASERLRAQLALQLALGAYQTRAEASIAGTFTIEMFRCLFETGSWIDASICLLAAKHHEFSSAWIDLLDEIGTRKLAYWRGSRKEFGSDLFALCRLHPTKVGLRWLAVTSYVEGPVPREKGFRQFPLLPETVEADPSTEALVRILAFKLRMTEVDAFASTICELARSEPSLPWSVVRVSTRLPVPIRVRLLLALERRLFEESSSFLDYVTEAVLGIAERRSSGFGRSELLRYLRLKS